MKTTKFQAIFGALVLITSFNTLSASKIMYKWTDTKGELHYTEFAPKDTKYTRIMMSVDTSSPIKAKTYPKFPTQDKKELEKKDTYGTWRDDNCKIAIQNLDMLQNSARITKDDGQGGKAFLTDDEIKQSIGKMKSQQEKYCKSADK